MGRSFFWVSVRVRVVFGLASEVDMAPQFSKGQRVKVAATKFDNENRDNEGMNFSERWLADGNGVWCYGTISRVYVKKGRNPQRYSVKYDTGGYNGM